MINRYKTQSISVNEEEQQAIKELAGQLRLKPAALARDLFYRGLVAFLKDGLIHADETDDVIFERLQGVLQSRPGIRVPAYEPNGIKAVLSEISERCDSLRDESERVEVIKELKQFLSDLTSLPKKPTDSPGIQGEARNSG